MFNCFSENMVVVVNDAAYSRHRSTPLFDVCVNICRLGAFGLSAPSAESRNVIDRQLGSWLKMYPDAARTGLIAEGWSDSVGSDDVCMQLSLKRAQTVANYISQTLGVPVTAIGKGKSSELPNTSEVNKQQNRRVVIKLRTAEGG
jgi:outer membrane protein OmpA-like peptidoglycan-associated protein